MLKANHLHKSTTMATHNSILRNDDLLSNQFLFNTVIISTYKLSYFKTRHKMASPLGKTHTAKSQSWYADSQHKAQGSPFVD